MSGYSYSLQNIIQENPFISGMMRNGRESPALSIGEAIDGPEKMISNPFLTEQPGAEQLSSTWEIHKQQVRERNRRRMGGERCALYVFSVDDGTDDIDEGTTKAGDDS